MITLIKCTHTSDIPDKVCPLHLYHIRSGVMFFWENSSSGSSVSLPNMIYENSASDLNNETILKVRGIKQSKAVEVIS